MSALAEERHALDRVIDLKEKHSTDRRLTLGDFWTEKNLKSIGAYHEESNVWRYREFELLARGGK